MSDWSNPNRWKEQPPEVILVADAIFKSLGGFLLRINCDGPARAAIEAMKRINAKRDTGKMTRNFNFMRDLGMVGLGIIAGWLICFAQNRFGG